MCGIIGIRGKSSSQVLHYKMTQLKHRGPDDRGEAILGDVYLGHLRLSIIDTEHGKQPISNENNSVHLVYNGEIYNYLDIKERFLSKHTFKTRTDSEVILHLFEECGDTCVEHLDGMYAFIIYDSNTKEFFAARDRLGIKPLYYGKKGETLFFASEMKALLDCDEIKEFPPGHYYSSETGFSAYYAFPPREKGVFLKPMVKRKLRDLLEVSIMKRLMSDVPVGVFLSGGIDSSIVASLMKKNNKELHSFCVGMRGSSDLIYAGHMAEYLGTKHHQYIYDRDDVFRELDRVIYYLESYDAPLVRSAIPCFMVSKLAEDNGIKVVLTGEGADELFAGYKYLRDFKDEDKLYAELIRITGELHGSNLQRVDRMSMANSVEARVPFLDKDFIRYVLSLPMRYRSTEEGSEKMILREAFKDFVPKIIMDRPKKKFSAGAGSMHVMQNIAEMALRNGELLEYQKLYPEARIRNEEELYYFKIFKKHFPHKDVVKCIGRTEVF